MSVYHWTHPVDPGPFRFGPQDPARPLADWTDSRLLDRTGLLVRRVVDFWRAGVAEPRALRLLSRLSHLPSVRDEPTDSERRELETFQ